ncbi:MAG: GHMP kinase [Candidatus Aminicenantes bacterium]|jgi:D-glycero-alpha-D-manno-heptose-7-phosphate kinase
MTRTPSCIIRATAPLRINDIGGWTDTWFSGEGKVLNLAVHPPVEVEIKAFPNKRKRRKRVFVKALDYGESFWMDPDDPDYTIHPYLQGAVNSLPIPKRYELTASVSAGIPAGSSVGTSAAVCVALIGAIAALSPQTRSLDEIASLAHRVETEKLELQSGIQDQICAAYGGICFIHMLNYPEAKVKRLLLPGKLRDELNQRLSLVFLGKAHRSSEIHEDVISTLEKGGSQFEEIITMRNLAEKARDCLQKGDLTGYGRVMVHNNECQRALHSGLVSDEADRVIAIAKKYNAAGWKVNGAGGKGGSITVLASRTLHDRENMLGEIDGLGSGIKSLRFSLSPSGLTVLTR